jgi:gluconolactonase
MKLKLLIAIVVCFSTNLQAQTPVQISTSTSYKFLEGPVWDGSEFIYFSDVNDFKVHKYSTINDTFEVAFDLGNSSIKTNGLMFDTNYNLVVCEFNVGKLSRRTKTGTLIEYLAETYDGKRFDNVNDLCIDKNGGVYFSDPTTNNSPNQSSRRIYYQTSSGDLTVVDDGTGYIFPNGIIISNDGTNLFVNDSQSYNIYKYDINQSTGALSNKQVFATLTDTSSTDGDALSRADGMALDTDENLYVSSKATVQVFNNSGALINTINFPKWTTNLTFGGTDKKTLYVTGWKEVYKVDLFDAASTVSGFQHPFDLPTSNLAVEKHNSTSTILYPNPIKNHQVSFKTTLKEINNITATSSLGKIFQNNTFTKEGNIIEVNLNPELKAGSYILSIHTENSKSVHQKIILK